ncbi:GNAT family N-acetyltransferase [Rhodococcus hoagii]|nr:GNAT family N-acetyltransferase [Prescottella equi]
MACRVGPLRVTAGRVTLRPIRLRDAATWSRLRIVNREHLEPWEPTGQAPWDDRHHVTSGRACVRACAPRPVKAACCPWSSNSTVATAARSRSATSSEAPEFGVDRLLGHEGRRRPGGGDRRPRARLDHCFGPMGLHRVEATVRPENVASRAVLEHAGFREEGLLRRYLDVDGQWRDHLLVAMTVEEVPGSISDRLVRAGRATWG